MKESQLMTNMYYPYGDYNTDIENIIQVEKSVNEERIKVYNESKKNSIPLDDNNSLDFQKIFEDISDVLYKSFDDIFEKKDYSNIFKKDRWNGIGYLCIIIYVIYFLSSL